jgi:hypothetical protein
MYIEQYGIPLRGGIAELVAHLPNAKGSILGAY